MYDGEMFDLVLDSVEFRRRGMLQGIGVFMVLRGCATLELNGVVHALEADDVVVANNRDICALSADSSNIVLTLSVFESFLERECREFLNYRYDCDSAARRENRENPLGKSRFFGVKRSLVQMMLACYKREDGYMLEVKRALLELLHNLYRNFRAAPRSAGEKGCPFEPHDSPESIQRALAYIHENYRGDVSLAAAAGSAGMSPQYFSRRFKQKKGVGFLEYLNRLRLDSAVRELLRTDESILKIAVNNGFADSNSFTALFKKVYGQTPKNYRLRGTEARGARTPDGGNGKTSRDRLSFNLGKDGADDLLKYVTLYDIHHGYYAGGTESISVALPPSTGAETKRLLPLSLPMKIFRIGRLVEALDDSVRDQLSLAQKKLRGDYICFQGIFDDGILPRAEGSYFKRYDYERILGFFRELDLTPFVRVDLSLAPPDPKPAVSDFMKILAENRLLSRWMDKIRFEVVQPGAPGSPPKAVEFVARFSEIRRVLKSFSPSVGVGFHVTSGNRAEEWANLSERLAVCRERDCMPDFLSLTIDPATEAASGTLPYEHIKNYGASQIEHLERVCAGCGVPVPELYVTEWNTLAGRTSIESSTFFRTALIAAELLSCGGKVSGVACWLNSSSKETLTGCVDNRVLALFFYGRIKRPPYYLLYLIYRLGGYVVHQSERLIVTMTGRNEHAEHAEYAAMLSNPCYFDPLYSVEEACVAMESVRVEVNITGIPKGRYRFSVFVFEKKHSSVFDRWGRVGYPGLSDEDVTDYLEHAILPEFNTFEDDIDASYTFSPDLGYNSVALYLFRRIG